MFFDLDRGGKNLQLTSLSAGLWSSCYGGSDTKSAKNPHYGADPWIALSGQCFVQAGATELGFLSDDGHADGARNVANGF